MLAGEEQLIVRRVRGSGIRRTGEITCQPREAVGLASGIGVAFQAQVQRNRQALGNFPIVRNIAAVGAETDDLLGGDGKSSRNKVAGPPPLKKFS